MCNEHTGPTAIVAVAGFVFATWRLRRVRAWMIAGLLGIYHRLPDAVLRARPNSEVRRRRGRERRRSRCLRTAASPVACAIVREFLFESRLGILDVPRGRRALRRSRSSRRADRPPRQTWLAAGGLIAASAAIIATLFVSPTDDRPHVLRVRRAARGHVHRARRTHVSRAGRALALSEACASSCSAITWSASSRR